MTRRTLPALLLAALLSLSLLTPAAAAARFSDVPASAWYASDVQDVQQYGILQGVGSRRYKIRTSGRKSQRKTRLENSMKEFLVLKRQKNVF